MAEKDKVPQIVVEMIVRLRNDKYHKWGYEDIAQEIQKEFGIQVTKQTVYYHYNRNKDLSVPSGNVNSQTFSKKSSILQRESSDDGVEKVTNKPIFKPKKKTSRLSEPTFKKDENIDLKDLFEPEE